MNSPPEFKPLVLFNYDEIYKEDIPSNEGISEELCLEIKEEELDFGDAVHDGNLLHEDPSGSMEELHGAWPPTVPLVTLESCSSKDEQITHTEREKEERAKEERVKEEREKEEREKEEREKEETHQKVQAKGNTFGDKTCNTSSSSGSPLLQNQEEKEYRCKFCNENLSSKSNLVTHIEICSKTYLSTGAIKNHKRKIDTNEKPYKLDARDRAFSKSEDMKRLDCENAKINSYACELCGKKFPREISLMMHMFLHTHEKNGFRCEECGASYVWKAELRRHMKTHTKLYRCDVCNRDFSLKHNLATHINAAHSEKRPHVCEVCKKRFVTKSLLETHIVTHSTVNPFN
ncbi:zinc finger protein 254-like [Penaeus japonicus]|uniref:zinc finger protein 254-like n=1 Tax=Penaeus japonicus TaxID=27405 RepID=UPI001C70EE18|nr:zinc finger protein 254-like [Penaeus japonicus]